MILGTVGLQTAIWNNNLKSLLLLALYPFILGALIWVIAALYGASMSYGVGGSGNPAWARAAHLGTTVIYQYWPAIVVVVSVWFLISLAFHTHMIRLLS